MCLWACHVHSIYCLCQAVLLHRLLSAYCQLFQQLLLAAATEPSGHMDLHPCALSGQLRSMPASNFLQTFTPIPLKLTLLLLTHSNHEYTTPSVLTHYCLDTW